MTADDLIYAAWECCVCGAGLAHPRNVDPQTGTWDCSAILLNPFEARRDVRHVVNREIRFNPIIGEDEPTARGATTRPQPGEEVSKT